LFEVIFDPDRLARERREFEEAQLEPNFFTDSNRAQSVMRRLKSVNSKIEDLFVIETGLDNIRFLIELAGVEKDVDLGNEFIEQFKEVGGKVELAHLTSLLRGKFDKQGAILSIQAGAGGTEAQDWADMLYRMYTRYADLAGFDVKVIDVAAGDGAGIKSATVSIAGENAYGFLRAEKGVHRLVRISPFDSNARRHTSFAAIEVVPEMSDDAEIEIRAEDLKIDTFRSGGAGGQHVNTSDSAVRIKHIPTGIVTSCQNERSQLQNKETAMRVLRGKLAELAEAQNAANINEVKGEQKKIEWGSQIRSYVFQPYTMVKDHRTEHETSNVTAVMNGELQDFINEFLRKS